ncbi:Uma2 family endonuclease [Streptomyces sp. NBC_00557]|uniref:Uma2 family endonuclease n=1 Tax=Streptomyces sp. NBC_00557 TaxID=2975776 RepID=UPI003FCE6367
MSLLLQLRSRQTPHVGTGNGYRFTDGTGGTAALLIPDLYALRHKPGPTDESHNAAHPGWYPADLLALVGEVTSTDHETDTGPKFRTYAAAGIPVHVLIDRHSKSAHCYTDPIPPATTPPRRTTPPTPR